MNNIYILVKRDGKHKNQLYNHPIILDKYDSEEKALEVLDTISKDLINNGLVVIEDCIDCNDKRLSQMLANTRTMRRYFIYSRNEKARYISNTFYMSDMYEIIVI